MMFYRDDHAEPVLPLGDPANDNTTVTFGQGGLSEAEGALPPGWLFCLVMARMA